jgi:hypothetical protein
LDEAVIEWSRADKDDTASPLATKGRCPWRIAGPLEEKKAAMGIVYTPEGDLFALVS